MFPRRPGNARDYISFPFLGLLLNQIDSRSFGVFFGRVWYSSKHCFMSKNDFRGPDLDAETRTPSNASDSLKGSLV